MANIVLPGDPLPRADGGVRKRFRPPESSAACPPRGCARSTMPITWKTCPHCQVDLPIDQAERLPAVCPDCRGRLLPEEPQWFYAQHRQKLGPVTWAQLRQLVASGQLGPTDMLLPVGSRKWVPAASV